MKRFLKILVIVLTCLLSSCSGDITKVKEIHMTSCKLVSVSPVGLRGLDVALDLGIDNPSIQFKVSDINIELKRNGNPLGYFVNNGDILLQGRTVGTYRLDGRVSLADGVSLFSVLGLVNKFDPEEFTVSYSAKVTLKNKMHTTLSRTDAPLKEFL